MCASKVLKPNNLPNAVKWSVNVFQSKTLNADAVHGGHCYVADQQQLTVHGTAVQLLNQFHVLDVHLNVMGYVESHQLEHQFNLDNSACVRNKLVCLYLATQTLQAAMCVFTLYIKQICNCALLITWLPLGTPLITVWCKTESWSSPKAFTNVFGLHACSRTYCSHFP